ncbi:MAG TPA: AraC family transcriptional regulator [Lachnospiraceae bacterium]|nr:AraC family transcriptional regulator [Lachnospiraceae bacterium]
MKKYDSITLKEELIITEIYSIHYFEYSKDFVYEGESHDFWELLCVDNGVIEVTADDRIVTLKKGEMIFHKPNEFHALRANGKTAPNLVVISFDCHAPCMRFFENQIISIDTTENFYMGQILTETKKTFYTPLNNPYICKLERYPNTAFGSEQIIKLSLESMLISIFRRCFSSEALLNYPELDHPMLRRNNDELVSQVVQYLNLHIEDHLTVAQICKDNMIGRSQLQKLFHQKKGCGIIEYFSYLKIDMAKKLIRENRYTYSQIASLLGYSSYQYFSLQFKKYTRMTPSEYNSSAISFFENDKN